MQLYISQKYFSVGDKFAITDENNQTWFLVQSAIMTLTKELNIFDPKGNEIYFIKAKLMSLFGRFVVSQNGNEVGCIQGKFHAPFRRRYVVTFGDKVYIVKGSNYAYKVKIYDPNDKKNPIGTVSKKVMKIADSYVVDFDQTKIEPLNAIAIGLVIDAIFHKNH